MAPLPKRRHSTRRGGKRKAAIKLPLPGVMTCKNCGEPRLPHRACPACGFYDGKLVSKPKTSKKSAKSGR